MHIPFISNLLRKKTLSKSVPVPSLYPPILPLTSLERLELKIIQDRIDSEIKFGEDNKKYYDDFIRAKLEMADKAGREGHRRFIDDVTHKVEMRRVSHGNHLTRLLEHQIEYENLRKGREL